MSDAQQPGDPFQRPSSDDPATPYQPPYQQQQPPYQYPQGQYPPYYQPQPPQTTNGLAIASLVLGIVWVYWIGSILAVIFGHVALNQIAQRHQGGRGLAIAGLVLGYVGVGVLALGLIGVASFV